MCDTGAQLIGIRLFFPQGGTLKRWDLNEIVTGVRSVARVMEDHENGLEGGGRVGEKEERTSDTSGPVMESIYMSAFPSPNESLPLWPRPAPLQEDGGVFSIGMGGQRRSYLHSSYMFRDRVA